MEALCSLAQSCCKITTKQSNNEHCYKEFYQLKFLPSKENNVNNDVSFLNLEIALSSNRSKIGFFNKRSMIRMDSQSKFQRLINIVQRCG